MHLQQPLESPWHRPADAGNESYGGFAKSQTAKFENQSPSPEFGNYEVRWKQAGRTTGNIAANQHNMAVLSTIKLHLRIIASQSATNYRGAALVSD